MRLSKTLQAFRGRGLSGPVLLVSPFAIVTLYLYLSRQSWHSWRDGADICVWLVSMAVGTTGLWRLAIPTFAKVAITPVYLVLYSIVIVVWTLSFVCGVFGDCL